MPGKRQRVRYSTNTSGLSGIAGCGPLAQIAPGVQAIGVFHPAVANIPAVIHIRDEYILDSRIDLRLSLPHAAVQTENFSFPSAPRNFIKISSRFYTSRVLRNVNDV